MPFEKLLSEGRIKKQSSKKYLDKNSGMRLPHLIRCGASAIGLFTTRPVESEPQKQSKLLLSPRNI